MGECPKLVDSPEAISNPVVTSVNLINIYCVCLGVVVIVLESLLEAGSQGVWMGVGSL